MGIGQAAGGFNLLLGRGGLIFAGAVDNILLDGCVEEDWFLGDKTDGVAKVADVEILQFVSVKSNRSSCRVKDASFTESITADQIVGTDIHIEIKRSENLQEGL